MSESPLACVLRIGFRHLVTAPNAEDAFEQIRALADVPLDAAAFHDAVAEAVRRGLIRDPVRLPPGSLQCHWHLELTQAGTAAARALTAQD